MEIAKQTDLIDKISEQYRPYIIAQRTPDLRSQERKPNIEFIYDAITQAIVYAGLITNDKQTPTLILAESFYNEVIIKYPFARHGEISLAFRKGVLREYGDYFGINVTTIYGWLKKFFESKDYLDAKKEWHNLQEAEHITSNKPLTQVFDISNEAILSVFNEFKEDGKLPIYARIYYAQLCKKKGLETLITEKETRSKIVKESKAEFELYLKTNQFHKREPELFKILMNSMDADNKTYLGISQKNALKYFFNECITKNQLPI